MRNPELFKKEEILEAHERRNRALLESLRKSLSFRSRMFECPVSADDARHFLKVWGEDPGPWMGAIFKKGFKPVGFKESEAEGNHGRIIRTWVPT